MKNVQKIDLGLTGYDELFANDEERKVNKLPRIFDIPISEIDDFPNHPFKVKIDEDEWYALISTRSYGSKCPYCSGILTLRGFNDFQTLHPELAAEWSERNGTLTPDKINDRSPKKKFCRSYPALGHCVG